MQTNKLTKLIKYSSIDRGHTTSINSKVETTPGLRVRKGVSNK